MLVSSEVLLLSRILSNSRHMVTTDPQRVCEGRTLSIIPNEIYMLIFDCLDGENLLRAEKNDIFAPLSLVCKLFRVLCQPMLFRDVTVIPDNPTLRPRTAQWLAHLAIGDGRAGALTLQVKTLTVIGRHMVSERATSQQTIESDERAASFLLLFPNIQSLFLDSVLIANQFLVSMGQCAQLKTLHITLSDIAEGANVLSVLNPSLTNIRCGIYHTDPSHFARTLSKFIDASKTYRLELGNVSYLKSLFAIVDPRLSLTYLVVEAAGYQEDADVLRLLQHMPRLSYLELFSGGGGSGGYGRDRIMGPPPVGDAPLQLHLPALIHLRCRIWMAHFLLRAAINVTTVDFDESLDGGDRLEEWEAFMEQYYLPAYLEMKQASGAIVSLTLPPSRTILARIAGDFPQLQELRFRCGFEFGADWEDEDEEADPQFVRALSPDHRSILTTAFVH